MLESSLEHLILNLNVTHIFYWCNNKVTREENCQREVKDHYANGVETTISSYFFKKNSLICFFWVYGCMIFFHLCNFAHYRLQLAPTTCCSCMWHGLNVVGIVVLLDIRFSFHNIFDAFGIIYPQYWL
jgi:hypothetical protein